MKKGFTLVEIIAVITILGIILLLIAPNIIDSVNKSKKHLYERQVATIEEAAKRWTIDHRNEVIGKYFLSINDLVEGDYIISTDITDPRNAKKMNGCIVILDGYMSGTGEYSYKYHEDTCESMYR